ncbi:MAG: GIY-YIG nuclease family protein [Fibrobacter sp.]|nr:GIY-YIG nuclease family protein [Fibrobacter sp.]
MNEISKTYYTYILFNKRQGCLYTGVTNNLVKRVFEHKSGLHEGFTKKYEVNKLGYYEEYNDIRLAISREKQLKAGNRSQKIHLIESKNPFWNDLYEELKRNC